MTDNERLLALAARFHHISDVNRWGMKADTYLRCAHECERAAAGEDVPKPGEEWKEPTA